MLTEAQLQNDLQAAMRARDMVKVYVLRSVVAAIKNLKVEKQTQELAEADLTSILRKEINKRAEALGYAEKAGRNELIDQNRTEMAMLEVYLPQQLQPAELESRIAELSGELGTTQIGPLMAELRKRYPGQFDGKIASELIKKLAG